VAWGRKVVILPPHQPGQLNSRAFHLPKENRALFFAYRSEKYNIVGGSRTDVKTEQCRAYDENVVD
jgi:hypothetical protein